MTRRSQAAEPPSRRAAEPYGALLVDKPAGPTSHDVVAQVRTLFGTRSVGHTGTLDPFATGLLVLVLGPATRLARWAERKPKRYRAVARLGQATTTDDLTGSVLADRTPTQWPGHVELGRALEGFLGEYDQRPPVYSAKRVQGERSYRLTRKDAPPELAPVRVMVHTVEVLEWSPPFLTFRAEVGPGTYLRALARDLGERLGIGGHLTELRRERVGPWAVEQAHQMADLTGAEPPLPPEALVDELDRIPVSEDEARLVRHGRVLQRADSSAGPEAGLYHQGRLIAVAQRVIAGWHPRVVLPEPAGAFR